MPLIPETAPTTVATPQDKQLRGVALAAVLRKRQLGQALNAKEFAVLVGVSYSTARVWLRLPGFPVIRGFVFWEDFVRWRVARCDKVEDSRSGITRASGSNSGMGLSPRASQILAEAS